ncbi:hypothetical protein ACOZDE_18840 [Streptomyces griseoincarnatus]
MLDPTTPLGVLVYAVIGAAIFRGLQLLYRRVHSINTFTPLGIIVCVVIGTVVAAGCVGLLIWLYLHVRLA